jgi:hypothetical protein
MELTELQKTQAAYAHFTLEEWKLLAQAVRELPEDCYDILTKFPSAVL